LNHVELYNVVQDLACYGYSGIDNASRVRKLLSGIKTDQLDSVKNQVMSDQDLATDFDRGEEENHNQNSRRRTTNISAVDIKDRYYTPQ
jgi:hypothetical protein